MTDDPPLRPQKTFQFRKYVIPADALLPRWRREAAPRRWLEVHQLVDEFPDRVAEQVVGTRRTYPEYRYDYRGDDPRYAGGVLPAHEIAASYLLRIQHGRAWGRHCVIHGPADTGVAEFNHDDDLLDYLAQLRGGRWSPRYWRHALRSWRNRRLPTPRYWPGQVVALNQPCTNNYFHWMAELLPRLATIRRSGVEPDWYLVDCYSHFQRETLRAFDVPMDRVIQPHNGLYVEAGEMVVPSRGFPGACREVGVELLERLGCRTLHVPQRIFVNRRRRRQARNLRELRRVLEEHRFAEHYLEDYPLSKQIDLFHHAEAIVAMHGAGLANLIFCKPGTHVIELMPDGKYQPCYPMLSRLGGLHHHLISVQRVGLHQDMLVPCDSMRAVLADLDARPSRRSAA